jgi:protoporphyrinogen oxidase
MRKLILGGGMTGLAAALASGAPVMEAADGPGGICSSYYVRPGDTERLHAPPKDGEAYRFELGGGHWIFGGDPTVLRFIRELAPTQQYARSSAVFFQEDARYVDYPIQNNLRSMPSEFGCRVLTEMACTPGPFRTMEEWLREYFGPTLCAKFFYPFHELYTAGMYREIAPQDAYKSPVYLASVINGMFDRTEASGYNVTFHYPKDGLNHLSAAMAVRSDIRYGRRVTGIDSKARRVYFADQSVESYDVLLCTLPLNKTIEMAGLSVDAKPDPYTSVLVLNIGGIRGPACPDQHWLYNPSSRSGFHRVGFYSNVDRSFLPYSARAQGSAVSIYVEKAYVGGARPSDDMIRDYGRKVVEELISWGFIESAEVVDPTWIDVAYTWEWPGSTWKRQALRVLQEYDIFMVGRYGRWVFQGIADSIRDGLYAGASLRSS